MSAQVSKQPLAGLGVVVGHAQHVTCGVGGRGSGGEKAELMEHALAGTTRCTRMAEGRRPTELVRGGEGRLQAVVLDDQAAPLGVAHRPHVGHAQRVAALLSADVLQTQTNALRPENTDRTIPR